MSLCRQLFIGLARERLVVLISIPEFSRFYSHLESFLPSDRINMGCSQSKATTDQIVERVSEDTSVKEAIPAPVNSNISASEVAIETSPASTEELPTVRSFVPVDNVKEASTMKESAAVLVEEKIEKPAESDTDHVEEVVDEEEAAALVTETLVPHTGTPVEEVAETLSEEEASKSEEKVIEDEAEALTFQSEPLGEDIVPKSEAAVKALEEEDELESEAVAVASVSETKSVESSLIFTAENVTFNDKGIAFYNFDGLDVSNPVNDVHISKRYSDFKALHAQLTGTDGKMADLPVLPTASFLQGRNNKKMLEDRKIQFTALLNAIAAHPLAFQSDVFKAFLA